MEADTETTNSDVMKPKLRGVSHGVFFFLALAAGAVLVLRGPPEARLGLFIYTASLCAMLGVSATYHLPSWGPTGRAWMRRIDHAAIMVLIAGTGTPFALLLPPEDGRKFLLVFWGGAAVGVLRAVFWVSAPKLLVAMLAVALGWASVPFFSQLVARLGAPTFAFLAVGGCLYTLGALAYAFRRPNPWPTHFGYHEVFHALVILAAACHFVAVVRAVS